MQGQRGTTSSLTEPLNFEYGSTSGGVGSDQQLLWSSFQNPGQDQMPGFVLPVNDTGMRCVNSFSHEPRELGRFGFSEPVVDGTQSESSDNRRGTIHGLTDMTAFVHAGALLEGRDSDHNPMFVQSTGSDAMCQNLNLNVDLVNHGHDNFQAAGPSNQYKSSGAENQLIPPVRDSYGFLLSSGGGSGYSIEGNDGRPSCPFGGGRASCKRKALEGNVGQSSIDASSSYFTHAESSAWTGFPAQCNEERNLGLSVSSEQVNPGLRLAASVPESIADVAAAASGESTRRNFRFRTNPSGQQNLLSRGSTSNHYVSALTHQPPSLEIDDPMNLMASPAVNHASAQNTNVGIRLPSLPQNVQSFSWNGASGSRSVASTSSIVPGGRDAMPLQERRLRSISRNMVNHPAFAPEVDFRNSGQNVSNRSSSDTSIVNGSLASTSRPRSSSPSNLSSPSWASSSSPNSQYPWRFSELVRRSLLSSLGAQSSTNHPPIPPSASSSPTESLFPPGVSNWGNHRSFPRSGSWLQRQGDGMVEIPHPLQSLPPGREGRRLVVSEIRNVLDLMRRGEGLRFEDVMILDQSVFFEVADIHDRHRDMRLDVDNMSYEELLALEERIGNVCTGLDEETISNRLKKRKWTVAPGGQSDAEPCCICQEEYNDGQDVGTLECGHDFHSECIKQWVMQKNLCPICKMTGLTK